jgi:ribosomal protein S18 acetylase RimI-like enzyme
MAICLHDLTARAPEPADLGAVSDLLADCARAEGNIDGYQLEDLALVWQRPDFQLQSDAWLILARSGQVAGYAAIWSEKPGSERLTLCVCVHPAYRGRGIGTLLLRLAEERARVVSEAALRLLTTTVVSSNRTACQLLEREGYRLVRSFWRVIIKLNASQQLWQRSDRLALDLEELPAPSSGSVQLVERAGEYLVRQYRCYEKPLRGDQVSLALETANKGSI